MFVSTQARILALIAVIEVIVAFVAALRSMGTAWAIISFGVSVLILLILILDQDCVVTGGCNVWAWVKLVFVSIFLLLNLVFSLLIIFGKKSENTSENTDEDKSKTETA
jgi:hypothetical protein